MIRPGKVESILLTEKEVYLLSKGNYVIYNNKVAQIQEMKYFIKILSTGEQRQLSRDEMSTLKRMVVTLKYGMKSEGIQIRRFPLKYEQWQFAIDNNLLNTGVPVSFEVITSSFISQHSTGKITTFIAIILSGKSKYSYTDTEVKILVDNAMYHAVSSAKLDLNGVLIVEQEEIDRWWEYNKYFES
ncbi:hypothetical protein SAMN05428988_3157 [Chitinophaga sp. YR573]|uniref:hypothetical protein n=1 Tax=Chitinophaga sp. YR573 TaxID=1881040 RepID=UPI0008C7F700|nr:hypothetical protein [Chitinophaga sp. YR573]SEW20981.1 hypothetical protein SAMN05428988_3157 [Chitinophaga sp. YR573]